MYKIFAVVFVAVAVSGQHYEHGHGHGHDIDYYAEPHYSFEYDVKDTHTGDIKSHKEERKGDHTQGVYMLVEPDGSKRIVEYVVEGKKGGWVPKIHRGPLKLKDKHGHEGIVHANQNLYQGKVQEVVYQTHGHDSGHSGYSSGSSGYSSGHGSEQSSGSSGYSSGYSSGHGSEQSFGGYKHESSGEESGHKSYGHGDATSSYTFSTHGAKVYTSTKHIVPQKHGY